MKVLTILGTSASLKDDIDKYGIEGDIMAVNRTIMDCHLPIKYAVSLHRDILDHFVEYRRIIKLNCDDVIKYQDRHMCNLTINTSGLSQRLGYDKVRVLGIAADSSGHYYDIGPTGVTDFAARWIGDNPDWIPEISKWANVEVASGNLLRWFPQLSNQ